MDERLHPPFPKKGDHAITKNYRSVTLTAIVGNALLLNHIQPQENPWGKSERFLEKSVYNITNLNYSSNHRRTTCKKSRGNVIIDLFKAFGSIHRRKIEQILQAYSPPRQKIVAPIMMHCKNTKAMVCSHIFAGVLLGEKKKIVSH